MVSKQAPFIEEFMRQNPPTESFVNVGSATSSRSNIPPTVSLDPPTGQTPAKSNNLSTRLLNGSRPLYNSIGVTVPANGVTIVPEEREEQVVPSRFWTFWEWYKNAVMDFRSTGYVHIYHLLISYIPIASIIAGAVYSRQCPQISFLPWFVAAVGIVGLVFMGFGIVVSCHEYYGTPCSSLKKGALGLICALFLILVMAEICLIGHISPNFDPVSENYCNETFYNYVICKNVVSAVAIIISALIYFPGSTLHIWCRDLPAPSPAGAFFSTL